MPDIKLHYDAKKKTWKITPPGPFKTKKKAKRVVFVTDTDCLVFFNESNADKPLFDFPFVAVFAEDPDGSEAPMTQPPVEGNSCKIDPEAVTKTGVMRKMTDGDDDYTITVGDDINPGKKNKDKKKKKKK
jgi:hypothetical protein